MLLDGYENIVLAKLIAIINGVTAEGDINKIKNVVYDVCNALKSKNDLEKYINYLTNLKAELLPDCLSCCYPCGRTNDFYLNDLDDKKRDDRIKEYRSFINSFNYNCDYNDVLYSLSKLSW